MKWQIRYSYAERPNDSQLYDAYTTRTRARATLARLAARYASQYGDRHVRYLTPDNIVIAGRTGFDIVKRSS